LEDVGLACVGERYQPADPALRGGISERRRLAFCTPYGCSKGAADQYVSDYAHSFGLATVTFRMSCIYGPHQFGTEDQGWVAHFLKAAIAGQPITIFGDGCQVRDILYVEDLVDALLIAGSRGPELAGRAFNMGGGPDNTRSLREVVAMIATLRGMAPATRHDDWRPGDQRYYVSDTAAFTAATGWMPTVSPAEGMTRLHDWLIADRDAQRDPERQVAA
jgi:CDP-paratose 2-epimerase